MAKIKTFNTFPVADMFFEQLIIEDADFNYDQTHKLTASLREARTTADCCCL